MEPPRTAVEMLGDDAAEVPQEALGPAVVVASRLGLQGGGALDATPRRLVASCRSAHQTSCRNSCTGSGANCESCAAQLSTH